MSTSRIDRHFSIALALLVALVLILLYHGARHFYARELKLRAQAREGVPVTRTGNPSGPRVLFLGDSRAAEWPALPADRFYTINAGGPGETTAQIRWRTEAVLAAEKPSVVVLQAGINDLKAIGVEPGRADLIQAQCLTNLQEIIHLCRRHDARVILTLVLPPGKVSLARRVVWSGEINFTVNGVNQALMQQFTNVDEVTILDLGKILAASRSNPNDFSYYRDTLHLKPEVYAKFEPELLRLIGQPAPAK